MDEWEKYEMAGGLIYLYRDEWKRLKNNRIVAGKDVSEGSENERYLVRNDLP